MVAGLDGTKSVIVKKDAVGESLSSSFVSPQNEQCNNGLETYPGVMDVDVYLSGEGDCCRQRRRMGTRRKRQ
jgi:hypothetical protein